VPGDIDFMDKLASLIVEDDSAQEGNPVPGPHKDAELVED